MQSDPTQYQAEASEPSEEECATRITRTLPRLAADAGAWRFPPVSLAVAWTAGVGALALELGLGLPGLLLALLFAGAASGAWARRACTRLRTAAWGPSGARRIRRLSLLSLALLLIWTVLTIFGGMLYLRGEGVLTLVIALVVLAPVGAVLLLPLLARRRSDDLWAAAFAGSAFAAIPVVGWLSAVLGWSGEPLRAALLIATATMLPLFGALLRPQRHDYDAISALMACLVLAGVIVAAGVHINTVPVQAVGQPGVWNNGHDASNAYAESRTPQLPEFSTGYFLKDPALGRAAYVPLRWHTPARHLPPFAAGANVALQAFNPIEGESVWFFLDLAVAELLPRPPEFSPDGRRLAVFLERDGAFLTRFYDVAPGKLGRLDIEVPGSLVRARPGVGAWWDGGRAAVVMTPDAWKCLLLPDGLVLAEAPRRDSGDLAQFYGYLPNVGIVLGPELPARPVLHFFETPDLSQELDLTEHAAAGARQVQHGRELVAQAVWFDSGSARAACIFQGGLLAIADWTAGAFHAGPPLSSDVLNPMMTVGSLNLPREFRDSADGAPANYQWLPAAGNPWFGEIARLGMVASSNARERAIFYVTEVGNGETIIGRNPLPGPVAADVVTGAAGELWAGRPVQGTGAVGWFGEFDGLPLRLRLPLRGEGRLLWPGTVSGRDNAHPHFLRVDRETGQIEVFAFSIDRDE